LRKKRSRSRATTSPMTRNSNQKDSNSLLRLLWSSCGTSSTRSAFDVTVALSRKEQRPCQEKGRERGARSVDEASSSTLSPTASDSSAGFRGRGIADWPRNAQKRMRSSSRITCKGNQKERERENPPLPEPKQTAQLPLSFSSKSQERES